MWPQTADTIRRRCRHHTAMPQDDYKRIYVKEFSNGRTLVRAICSLDSRTPEAIFAPLRGAQFGRLHHFGGRKAMKNQLGDPIAPAEGDGLGAAVLKHDSQLTPVVRIDGPGTVRECNTMA